MTKVKIVDWCFQCEKQLTALGLSNRKEIEFNTPEEFQALIQKIFNSGLNVMLAHGSEYVILAVDTKKFQQR